MTPQEIADEIRHLTAVELAALLRILGDDPELLGVREPRRPTPESPGDALAVEIEE